MSNRILLSALLIGAALPAFAQQRFIVEREIPGASRMTPEQLAGAAQKSNGVLRNLGPDIQWVQSYVAGDKIYCVYVAENPELIKEHARCGGFPADMITKVSAVIDPTTGEA